MNIRIEGHLKHTDNVVDTILHNRGLDRKWLNANEDSLLDGSTMRNFTKGYELIKKHSESRAVILVD